MKKEIYTKKGELSAYGLACGYVEKRESKDKEKRLSLFMENGIFTVIFFGHEYINKGFEDLRSARATFKFLTEKHF